MNDLPVALACLYQTNVNSVCRSQEYTHKNTIHPKHDIMFPGASNKTCFSGAEGKFPRWFEM